jgi:hypothetical protein
MSDRSFSVDIGGDHTVGHLKDAIVKKNPVLFEGVNAYELDLWKVSTSVAVLHSQLVLINFLQDIHSD